MEGYIDKYGDALVPQSYFTRNQNALGNWVNTQRTRKVNLSPKQVKCLEALTGWVWDLVDHKWEQGFELLLEYSEAQGNCLVPTSFNTASGYHLGSWVKTIRRNRMKMPNAQNIRLEALKGWVWDINVHAWEMGFELLLEYVKENGDAMVDRRHVTSGNFSPRPDSSTQPPQAFFSDPRNHKTTKY